MVMSFSLPICWTLSCQPPTPGNDCAQLTCSSDHVLAAHVSQPQQTRLSPEEGDPPQENRDLLFSLTPLPPAAPALQRQGLGVTHLSLPITEEQACSWSLSEGLSRAE